MKLKDIPSTKGNRYPERISLALTREQKQMLETIRQIKKKDPAELMRMLLDEFVAENSEDLAG